MRNNVDYIEPASSVALGVEQKCIIVLGDPEIGVGIHEYYANIIVRVTDFEKLLG